MMRRSLLAVTTLGLLAVTAACGSDDDTDVTTPDIDVTVPSSVSGSDDSLDDPTMDPTMTTMDPTMDTVGGVASSGACSTAPA